MSAKLDSIVKGAVPPSSQISDPPSQALASTQSSQIATKPAPSDPTALLPSSPPQIYHNLMVLEASLRAQYLTLRSRRRQNTLVLTALVCWVVGHAYWLILPNPLDVSSLDGNGANGGSGGSVGTTGYWLMDVWAKLALMSGLFTIVLFWGTGQWERGVRWPRKWVGVSNRGLRVFNCKIVVLRGPLWRELLSSLVSLLRMNPGPTSCFVTRAKSGPPGNTLALDLLPPRSRHHNRLGSGPTSAVSRHSREVIVEEEDLTPGGDHIKLLLLSKPFSPDFRQAWEEFRTAFWERENERRANVRKKMKVRMRELAKQQGGWLWWTGWRGWPKWMARRPPPAPEHRERHELLGPNSSIRRRLSSTRPGPGSVTHSRTSSRSSTPSFDVDDVRIGGSRPSSIVMLEQMERRWSGGSAASARRKKATGPPTSGASAKSGRASVAGNSRPTTPER